ncbi:hypothetical protein BH10BAC5_BH10BAC5_14510 [soil metagenome]
MLKSLYQNKNSFIVIASIAFIFINLPLFSNSTFISDDYSVIYLAQKDPFPVFSYYEKGLNGLIKDFKPEVFKYRPLTSLSLYLNEKISGLESLGFHITNMCLHIFAFVIVFKTIELILRLIKYPKNSQLYFLSLFYLINPACSNEVNWIATRSDILIVVFGMFCLYSTLKFLLTGCKKFFVLSILSFACALMSKENAVLIPFLEIVILIQITLSAKKNIFAEKNMILLTGIKLFIIILYFVLRYILSSFLQLSTLKTISILDIFPVILKTFLFILLPIDSGTWSYLFKYSFIAGAFILLISILPLLFYITVILLKKNKILMMQLFFLLLIWLTSTFIFIILGGVSHRLLILTIAFSIPSICILIGEFLKDYRYSNNLIVSLFIAYLVFYTSGYLYVSNNWIQNMKTEKNSIVNILNDFDPEKKYVFITYPHSIGQTYCFSDIGMAVYFHKNHMIGNYNNITQGAAINSFSLNGFKPGNSIKSLFPNKFEITSLDNSYFFTPGAYFNEEMAEGRKDYIKNGITFLTERTNFKNKALQVMLTLEDTSPSDVIFHFNIDKFEKL